MLAKRRGIVAVPGSYKYGDATEIKTALELQEVAKRQPSIILTLGHPSTVFPKSTDYIGKVFLRWDSKRSALAGEFSFFDERVPPVLAEKLSAGEVVGVSAGFLVDEVMEDGTQNGIVLTHVALIEGEDPRCPIDTCGVNVRMDADLPTNYRYEQSSELPSEGSAEEKPKQKVPEEGFNPIQMEQLKKMVSEMIPKPPEPVKEEIEVAEVEQEPEPEQEDVLVPEPVPEVLIPATGSETSDGLQKDELGRYVFKPRYKNQKE